MYYTTRNGEIYEEAEWLPHSTYFCDFEDRENNECLNDFKNNDGGYKIVNSIEYENWPVFDMRWEDLPAEMLHSTRESDENRLSFTKILKVQDGENLKVTLSLRASEVHFLLCDQEDVTSANCYWFIIQGWRGKKTVLRKCNQQIPDVVNEYPKTPCVDPVVEIKHPDVPSFLNTKKWNHLTLEKLGQNLYLRNIENGKSTTIIEYSDKADNIDVRYLLGHTKDPTSAYYKLHKHQYLRTSQASSNDIFFDVPEFDVENQEICFSVMLTTCRDCWTTFFAFSTEGTHFIDNIDVPPSYVSKTLKND
ncbi:hypothetical protein WA026_004873 [Henosepilachna vigintioctopunctata]|uniref:Uncharacterized protein n=1 Tax=Henosepilachna vigintioctopunctata TaxID=420089 RepID=A0AAW1URX1_9CUCU